jgi:hypothetical protein
LSHNYRPKTIKEQYNLGQIWVNKAKFWFAFLPAPSPLGNKYDRDHAVIIGAPELTGATRLAATDR